MEERPKLVNYDFTVGTVVLAYHGSLLYEAKVLSIQYDSGQSQASGYLVHFQGWKKSWDATVPRGEVFEHNDDNLRLAHKLLRGAKMRQQAIRPVEEVSETIREGKPNKPKDGDDPNPEDTRKTGTDLQSTQSADALFQLPGGLKRQLVDDWEFVTKEQKLVDLPRGVTVDSILQKWLSSRRAPADMACREVADSLRTYFNAALPAILLYRFERHQYNEMFHGSKAAGSDLIPSAVYGAEHLLRLLLKLPFMLDSTGVDKEMIKRIAEKVNDLAKYMQKNGRLLFLAEYESASNEYITAVARESTI